MEAKAVKETPAIVKAKQRIYELERQVADWQYTCKDKDAEILKLSIEAAGKNVLFEELNYHKHLLRDICLPQVALKMAENHKQDMGHVFGLSRNM